MRYSQRFQKLNLALQGGGVHGAFTWGVLDAILADTDITIGWISGSSAGAVNAAAVAHGIAHDDMKLAQSALEGIWRAVERAGIPDLLRFNPILSGLAQTAPIANMSGFLSPYEFNPIGFDPLRQILTTHIDFEAVRNCAKTDLIIAATDVATGRARLFRRHDLSVDVVLASACLPMVHHAVEIDGCHYWDGGFSANPDLLTLATKSPVRDTLLVQLNPIHKPGAPRGTKEIEDRVNTITFNQPLLRDIETIVMAQEMRSGWFFRHNQRLSRLKGHRFHLIAAGRHTSGLGADSKVMPHRQLLTYLRNAGQGEAVRWLDRYKTDIGHRSTVDLRACYLDPGSLSSSEDHAQDEAAGNDQSSIPKAAE